MHDDTRLLLAARDGDETCFALWVRRTHAEVWRMCAHLVDAAAADDVAQDVYVRAWRALPAFRGDAAARTWLLSITRRACADAVRSRVRRRRLAAALGREPARQAGDAAGVVTLTALVAGLPHDRRVAFALTQLLGLSYEDAATVCGCPIGTIRSRVARARAELVTLLDRAQDDLPGVESGTTSAT